MFDPVSTPLQFLRIQSITLFDLLGGLSSLYIPKAKGPNQRAIMQCLSLLLIRKVPSASE